MAKTFYDIFEVDAHATPDEIRAGYKRMVQRHHPDKHSGETSSEELLKALNYAYNVLSNPRKRASYDARLFLSAQGVASSAYTQTGEATLHGAAASQPMPQAQGRAEASSSADAARVRAPEATTRKFEAHLSGLSHLSYFNSWLALGMLLLVFLAISRFFYQITEYRLLNTAELGSMTLFYGIMIGAIIAGGAVWLMGKMIANNVPLAWPMNLIFRERVRSDLQPGHRKIVSAVLVLGILLTFVMPDAGKTIELVLGPAAPLDVTAQAGDAAIAAQNPRKNTTVLFPMEPVGGDVSSVSSPMILAQNLGHNNGLEQREVPLASAPKIPIGPIINEAVSPPIALIPPPPPVKPVESNKPATKKTVVEKLPAKVTAVTPRPAPTVRPRPPVKEKVAVAKPQPPVSRTPPAKVAPPLAVVEKPATKPAVISEMTALPASVTSERKEIVLAQNDTLVVEPDESALIKYRQSAEQGTASAQYQLGRAHEKGEGAPRDYKQAITWYRKAADQGYGPAQHSLGSMYMLGKGVAMDPVAAYVWLSIAANNTAARNGNSNQQVMDYLVDTLTSAQLANAKRQVAKWSPERKR